MTSSSLPWRPKSHSGKLLRRAYAEKRVGLAAITIGTVLAATCLLALATRAAASTVVSTYGSGAGQVSNAAGAAVDSSNGRLYLADSHNNRIDVYDVAGNFVMAFGWGVGDGTSTAPQTCSLVCFAGISGAGRGQFTDPTRIVVDNDPTSPAYHDVYVAEEGRVQAFTQSGEFVFMIGGGVNVTTGEDLCTAASGNHCGAGISGGGPAEFESIGGVAIGAEGALYVVDSDFIGSPGRYSSRIEKFDASLGTPTGEIGLPSNVASPIQALAVESSGDFYVAPETGGAGIVKYDPTGSPLYKVSNVNAAALALDPSNDLFASQATPVQSIVEYSESGAPLSVFGYGANYTMLSLAFYASPTGDLYAPEEYAGDPNVTGRLLHISLPSEGPVVLPTYPGNTGGAYYNMNASKVSNHGATLTSHVNPEGESTTYHFQYVDQMHFEAGGFSNAATASSPESAPVGSDFELHAATVVLAGLAPKTVYHYRLAATNADGESVGPEATFETLPPLQINGVWSTEVGADAATLHVAVNPLGISTTGVFQYVDTSAYSESGFAEATEVPDVAGGAAPIDFGSGETARETSVVLQSLASRTTYHYRFVARDPFVAAVDSPTYVFTTQGASGTGDEGCPNQAFRVGASAVLPDCRAYEMVSPVDKNNTDIVSLININSNSATLDQSAASGEKLAYSTSQGFGDAKGTPYVSQYIASRGSDGWQSEGITPPQGLSGVEIGHRIDIEFRSFTADLCSGVLVNSNVPLLAPGAAEGFFNLYRRQGCGGESYEALTTAAPPAGTAANQYEPDVQGTSADGSCTVFRAAAPLTPDAGPGSELELYESCGGHLYLLSVLPSGKASTLASSAGTSNGGDAPRDATLAGAVSSDGSRVYWTASGEGAGKLYLRENSTQGQSKVSAGKCTEAGKACTVTVSSEAAHFWGASLDGSRAFYTVEESSRDALYEFDLRGGVPSSTAIAEKVMGVLGAGEGASQVYFVSEEVLTGANAQGKSPSVGEPNAYLFDASRSGADRYRFIGTLSAADAALRTGSFSPISLVPYQKTSRVSSDGLHVAFMSSASLTGYDNIDVQSGEADAEVYAYDATADNGEGLLSCVSCNPTGQRPSGRELPIEGGLSGTWAAALLPPYETELYGSRVISANGERVFFDSYEALVPRDTNGKADVYEWEMPGSGGCSEASTAFSAANGGCVDLISSGESATDSEFVDASPDGDDVFFTTAASLVPQDPGLIDIYDARVDGGFAAPAGQPSSCEGEACQSAPSPPKDATPASASFSGWGNLVPAPVVGVAPKEKTASQLRAQELAKALKACKAKAKSKRKGCEATARKRYSAQPKKKARRRLRQRKRPRG